ncbi:class I SAM-dependent methyltransferase [Candidatus Pelagibacter sp.]|uniref:class I SAM-dependent methyltransferase n=1 Tax=Candidatus Pelagibacter sp. TaxID=2024849 RepID=UPI003D107128
MKKYNYSKQFWNLIAKENPYFGVLADESFKTKNLNEDKINEFYKSGEIFIDNLLNKNKLDKNITALDFGCGAGRLTFPLKKYFKNIYGYDISKHYIELCEEHSKKNSSSSKFIFFNNYKKLFEQKYDFINSYIVFQHIPEEEGYKIINDLLNILNSRGLIHLHIIFLRSKHWLNDIRLEGFFNTSGETINFYSLDKNSKIHKSMSMYTYDLNKIFFIINKYNKTEVKTVFENHSGNLGLRFLFNKDV